MQQAHRVALQDAFAIRGIEIELVDDGARILDVLGVEAVGAHHDAVGADNIDQEGNAICLCQLNATPEPQA